MKNCQILERPILACEEKRLDIAQPFIENPYLSMLKANQQHGISRMAAQKILKKIKFHTYKINLVQELNEDDFDLSYRILRTYDEKTDDDPQFSFQYNFLG